MKVLQINAVYGHGSTGTIIRDIEHLCELSGIECYIASPDPQVREAKRGYIIGNTLDHKLHALFSRIHGKQAYYSHIPTRQLLYWIDKVKPNIVHLHNLHSNYIHLNMLLRYLAKKNIRTIITLHDCWFYTGGCYHYTADGCQGWLSQCGICPKEKRDPASFFSKASAQILADRKKYFLSIPQLVVTGVSHWISDEARRTFFHNTKIITIHNGIDMNVFKPTSSDIRSRLSLEDKYIILGPASKWLDSINKEVLLSFSQQMQHDEILLLFGATSIHTDLPANVQTYGYTKNREELAQLYTMADVFANVTREDSLSLINLEAQACGTPVVTFDQTGPKETVDDVNSFNVPVGDTLKLYEAIRKVRQQTTSETTTRCRNFVREQYNMDKMYLSFIDLYKQVGN